ncbi:hypothetical protein CEXT_682801 [Caerostris extrusa]|uniref:Uncharacterized protein n=1 Tax=Caerostris extrusa TaxID=172846 RepID=A0AAV4R0U7_CAEEX|nr:hypothetical protein CEXT_682801 [Caerostris extrusa]
MSLSVRRIPVLLMASAGLSERRRARYLNLLELRGISIIIFPQLTQYVWTWFSSSGGGMIETMDSSTSEDEAKRLSETTPSVAQTNNPLIAQDSAPAVVMDQFLYDNADEIIKIIELKSKLTADWFRPVACKTNLDLAKQYDLVHKTHLKEMEARCANLRISQIDVPVTINELKDRVEYLYIARQATTTPAHSNQIPKRTSAPPRRGTDKRPLDADGFRLRPKHVVRGTTANATPELLFPCHQVVTLLTFILTFRLTPT